MKGGRVVGRRGLEPRTSAVERLERCADDVAGIKMVERRKGCYQDAYPTARLGTQATPAR